MNPRLEALRAKRDGIEEKMGAIDAATALRSDLAMTEDETKEYAEYGEALTSVSTDIDNLAESFDRQRSTSETLARITAATPAEGSGITHVADRATKPMTPGEYACTVYRSQFGETVVEREEATTLLRTVQETGTADTSGILPTPIIGDLVKFVDASRPLISAMRPMPMPAKGKTFSRPRLTQSTQSAAQTEKSQLQSRQLTTTGDTVTKATHGTVLNLTEQDIDWSDPALLDIAYEDMAEQYAIDTETTAATAVAAAATTTTAFDISTAGAGDITPALALAAASVYNTAKRLPDTVLCAVNVWAFLAGLVDGDDRPLFPNLSPVNAPGTLELTSFSGNPMGLKLVVSPHFADNFFAVGASRLLEQYEINKGFVTVNVPSVLEQQVAYRGYFATNCYAQGLCSLQ